MPMYMGDRRVNEVFFGGRKIREVWVGGRRVFSAKPVEVMPATSGDYDAQGWLRDTVRKYGLNYRTVTELPFDIDSRNATKMDGMFYICSALTTVPQMDTSKVTRMK